MERVCAMGVHQEPGSQRRRSKLWVPLSGLVAIAVVILSMVSFATVPILSCPFSSVRDRITGSQVQLFLV
ncbi:hypothetical protein BGZ63DRAFT_503424 [Mariannaea sp. PMI_226]|nr:hypothetical protein BGZ63DRAFT_503424 [Mariannaea sp. PMI_226]